MPELVAVVAAARLVDSYCYLTLLLLAARKANQSIRTALRSELWQRDTSSAVITQDVELALAAVVG